MSGWREVSPLDASMDQRRWKKKDGWGFPERTGSDKAVLMVSPAENSGEGTPEIGGGHRTAENAARLLGRGCGLFKGS